MPTKRWTVPITATDIMVNRLTTERGKMTGFLAQYVAEIDGELHPVIRFDTAHGIAHRDILDWNGETFRKDLDWAGSRLPLKEAFDLAQAYIKENWESELTAFLRRRSTR